LSKDKTTSHFDPEDLSVQRTDSGKVRREKFHRRMELIGWWMFVISAIFFIWASVKSGDIHALLGGVFFLLACVAFLLPYYFKP